MVVGASAPPCASGRRVGVVGGRATRSQAELSSALGLQLGVSDADEGDLIDGLMALQWNLAPTDEVAMLARRAARQTEARQAEPDEDELGEGAAEEAQPKVQANEQPGEPTTFAAAAAAAAAAVAAAAAEADRLRAWHSREPWSADRPDSRLGTDAGQRLRETDQRVLMSPNEVQNETSSSPRTAPRAATVPRMASAHAAPRSASSSGKGHRSASARRAKKAGRKGQGGAGRVGRPARSGFGTAVNSDRTMLATLRGAFWRHAS